MQTVRRLMMVMVLVGSLASSVLVGAAPAPAAAPEGGVRAQYAGHWVLVNLAQQRMYAYDGARLVDSAYVSTGLPGKETPVGSFWVQQRYRSTTMAGPGYYLENVPYTQYFGNDWLSWQAGYALHGTYWHNNFGTPMSSGCVNMNNNFAAFIWDFAGVGTPVEVVEG